jgi:hypothetical protein
VARRKGTELSVFKGREAKLNRAIFRALALKGPQTIYDVHKQLKYLRDLRFIRYGNINRRVRSLEKLGFIRIAGMKKTKAGFEATLYEVAAKACLALLLDSISLDEMLCQMDEGSALGILSALVGLPRRIGC